MKHKILLLIWIPLVLVGLVFGGLFRPNTIQLGERDKVLDPETRFNNPVDPKAENYQGTESVDADGDGLPDFKIALTRISKTTLGVSIRGVTAAVAPYMQIQIGSTAAWGELSTLQNDFTLALPAGMQAVSFRARFRDNRYSPVVTSNVLLNSIPQASLSVSNISNFVTVADARATYDLDDATLEYAWDLNGDGTNELGFSTSNRVLTNFYTNSGTNTIVLTVRDAGGASVSVSKPSVRGDFIPIPVLTVTALGQTNYFLDGTASYDPGREPIEWAWDFNGDGLIDLEFSAANSMVNYFFTNLGSNSVVLYVRDHAGSNSQTNSTAVVCVRSNLPPVPICYAWSWGRTNWNFNTSSTYDTNGNGIQFAWDFDGDGNLDLPFSATGSSPTFIAPGLGTNQTVLWVRDSWMATNAMTLFLVATNAPPVASFSVTSLSWQKKVFDAGSSWDYDDPAPFSYAWDINGDGINEVPFSAASKFTNIFTWSGTNQVVLTVRDPWGYQSQKTNSVIVMSTNPVAAFWIYDRSSTNKTFIASNLSYDPDTGSSVWLRWDDNADGVWDTPFSTGLLSRDKTYTSLGSYGVVLQVSNQSGKTATVTNYAQCISSIPSISNLSHSNNQIVSATNVFLWGNWQSPGISLSNLYLTFGGTTATVSLEPSSNFWYTNLSMTNAGTYGFQLTGTNMMGSGGSQTNFLLHRYDGSVYCSTTGNNTNYGTSSNFAVRSIPMAIDRAASAAGTGVTNVMVSGGLYTPGLGIETPIVLPAITGFILSGGWDGNFKTNTNVTVLDGVGTLKTAFCMTNRSRFIVRNFQIRRFVPDSYSSVVMGQNIDTFALDGLTFMSNGGVSGSTLLFMTSGKNGSLSNWWIASNAVDSLAMLQMCSNVRMVDSQIRSNSVVQWLRFYNSLNSSLLNCQLFNNLSFYGFYHYYSDTFYSNVTVASNGLNYPILYMDTSSQSQAKVDRCSFISNSLTNFGVVYGGTLGLYNSTFSNNGGPFSGIVSVYPQGSIAITNNYFIGTNASVLGEQTAIFESGNVSNQILHANTFHAPSISNLYRDFANGYPWNGVENLNNGMWYTGGIGLGNNRVVMDVFRPTAWLSGNCFSLGATNGTNFTLYASGQDLHSGVTNALVSIDGGAFVQAYYGTNLDFSTNTTGWKTLSYFSTDSSSNVSVTNISNFYIGPIESPVGNPPPGCYSSNITVTLSSPMHYAFSWSSTNLLYFTTNGAAPTLSSTLYQAPIVLNTATTIKAFTFRTNFRDSLVTNLVYAFTNPCPTIIPSAATNFTNFWVAISAPNSNTQVFFTTNGTTPDTSSISYTGPFLVEKGLTVKTVAVRPGWSNSAVNSVVYVMTNAMPTFNPPPGDFGTNISVAIESINPGVTIYYTTNGATPTTGSLVYGAPISMVTNMTLKAFATKAGWGDSAVTNGLFNFLVGAPVTLPTPGAYRTNIYVSLSSSTPGATIYYTTNGTVPTIGSTLYSGPFLLTNNTTVRALAVKSGWVNSIVSTNLFEFGPVVTTFAGRGFSGMLNGNGTNSAFYQPFGLVFDASGNLYVSDWVNHLIRKIDSATNVTTFAGSVAGFSNDAGASAQFYNPGGISVDLSGNLVLADYGNHRIRKIAPDTSVSTVAGSGSASFVNATGTAASFYYPVATTCDLSGNIFVADTYNHRIRKISSTGVVTTLAGSGTATFADGTGTAASFYSPSGIVADGSGNVYVSDTGNHRIRKITSAGVVTTIAGSGTSGFLDGSGTSAWFYSPMGLVLDPGGNLFVADYNNNRIRKVTAGGVVTTLAGTGTQGLTNGIGAVSTFRYPRSIAMDSSGNLYVADEMNHVIRKIEF